MAQDTATLLPQYLNLDTAYEKLSPVESPFIKGLEWGINSNPDIAIGASNPSGEGQNSFIVTPSRSNVAIPGVVLPDGFNKNVGAFESTTTQELYWMNYNSKGNHGVYVFNANSAEWKKVIVDPKLNFSDDPTAFMAEHRVTLRVRKDADGNVFEKYLLITDGNSNHKWIDVIAAIETDGFNANLYPYWNLQPPHFDREELFEWAVRSPMYAPKAFVLPNTIQEKGKPNKMAGAAFEFCFQDIFTDGRETLTSPFSLPVIIKTSDFLSNPDLLPKRIQVDMYAGSPKLEKRNVYVRRTKVSSDSTIDTPFGDWYLYDTIYKFSDSGNNSPSLIGGKYWLRTNGWANYSYNPALNTISYIFDNSKIGTIVSQELFTRLNNDMPQLSVAMSDLGDSVQLCNNRNGFDNIPQSILNKFSCSYNELSNGSCSQPLREIKLYVYAGRERGNAPFQNSSRIRGIWGSQLGYYNGDDTQMRFGGMWMKDKVIFSLDESKYFDLDFADKDGFRCYLKGTPFYSDCEWHICKSDFSLEKIEHKINVANDQDQQLITNAIKAGSFFVGVFTFNVPAGRYIATLGRHNVASSGDYRNESTYIMGIANSRTASNVSYGEDGVYVTMNTVKPNGIVSLSKEIEIDCTLADVDVWGRGSQGDLFYVMVPFVGDSKNSFGGGVRRWQMVEGYLKETADNKIPMEFMPYTFGYSNGAYTDKNGFFFGYIWGQDDSNNEADVIFLVKKDCTYPFGFTIDVPNGFGWKRGLNPYFATYNTPLLQVGNANRILVSGKITDLTGQIPYSNISVSLVGGATEYTDQDGNFTIVVHNGMNTSRVNNIYINASGNFLLASQNCGFVPLLNFDEALVPCQTTFPRNYPFINQRVNAQSNEFVSTKSGASYEITVVGADIASRVTYANKIGLVNVKSFTERNNDRATQLSWALSGNLQLQNDIKTKNLKWLAFYAVNASNYRKYIQWVGSSISFLDNNGNTVIDTGLASLVKIDISSLLQTNIKNNFTLLSGYQFQKEDRLRVYDNGSGDLLNTQQYGDTIDVEVFGTNYNQAAIASQLIPPSENTVLPGSNTFSDSTALYVRYDKRFDVLKDKKGFWIEIYTPSQTIELLPYGQIGSFYPIINGEIAEYVSGGINNPVYNFPTSASLEFWDTYLIRRNIIGIPSAITHPFESPNITDTWGANCVSSGKQQTSNENAACIWYIDSTIKSDDFVGERIVNGLGTFRSKNIKNFKGYQRGGIVAVVSQNSTIFFLCENDYFTTDFNFNYIFANEQGVQVSNLDNSLSVPHQKIGMNFGCRLKDTSSVVKFDEYVSWVDVKNNAVILCDYQSAIDVSNVEAEGGQMVGIKSYLSEKIKVTEDWNYLKANKDRFDIICGFDLQKKNLHVTFRPRRNNTTNPLSFVSERRNVDLLYQETLVYNTATKRWIRFANFAPESYGKVRGNKSGVELVSFASGLPYLHNSAKNSFLVYFGVQTEPCFITVLNKDENVVKVLQALSVDINNSRINVDMIYSTQVNGFSYLPANYFVEREKMFYAPFLRDMVSYLSNPVNNDFRSTLIDGKRLFGEYFVMRFVQNAAFLGKYFELNGVSLLFAASAPAKPPSQ